MEQLSDLLLQVVEFVGVEEVFQFYVEAVTYDLYRFDAACLNFSIQDVSDGCSIEATFHGKPGWGEMILFA